MILSVSRRTDIPNYYSEWFYNRIKEGFLYVRNPMNAHQISEIKITPDVVDCIVFWTKNPLPMMKRLNEIKDYNYYFQFTLTGYGNDVEVNLPNKKTEMIPVFQELSEKIGKQKVIWRYDPIFFSDRYTKEYHLKAFKSIAEALSGYTEKCVISFVDIYPKNKKNMDGLSSYELNDDELREFAEKLSKIAADNNIKIGSCAEKIDLDECGIIHNCCIDRELIEKIIGCKLNVGKDKNQRKECGCVESVEIGTYNTCKNGCAYCYANYSSKSVETNAAKYDPSSPLLCGQVQEDDKITIRKVENSSNILYHVGDKVEHAAFGTGIILSIQPIGNDNLLEIEFSRVGTKKLFAKFARLERQATAESNPTLHKNITPQLVDEQISCPIPEKSIDAHKKKSLFEQIFKKVFNSKS